VIFPLKALLRAFFDEKRNGEMRVLKWVRLRPQWRLGIAEDAVIERLPMIVEWVRLVIFR